MSRAKKNRKKSKPPSETRAVKTIQQAAEPDKPAPIQVVESEPAQTAETTRVPGLEPAIEDVSIQVAQPMPEPVSEPEPEHVSEPAIGAAPAVMAEKENKKTAFVNTERRNDMITRSDAESFKVISPLMLDLFPQGAVACIIMGNRFEWVANARSFTTQIFKVGETINSEGVAARAMQQQRVLTDRLAADLYGVRLVVSAAPIIDGSETVGAVVIAVPRINPLEMAFKDFAPILSQVFPDGCFVYLTDLSAFTHRHGDQKFDLPTISIGTKFNEGGVAYHSIRQKQAIVKEIDASAYGEECLVGNFPLFDEEDPTLVVGTFGIATPKRTAMKLRHMSNNMHDGMGQIASAIEEMSASAFEINTNEQKLNANVQDIARLSEDINEILGFIKQIAEETKMLGLNAAIEAARAGEAGRGFGVVAEEIRKLSDESKDTVTKIRGLTDEIKVKIEDTIRNSTVTLHSSEEQAAATQEVTAQVEELNSLAEELQKISMSV